ncbi:pectinesterase-like [Chenopodium quinoa]|uniref:pectinesterase-like n=1 Tax=Chenopodium quinoa TaxID=63459 RepID=UPI000B78EC55|nr:pectinesterase-like [Chenopodium quinoa]
MGTSNHYQSLINHPKTTQKTSHIKLFIFLSITLISLYLCFLTISFTNNHSSICNKSHDRDYCLELITEAISNKSLQWTLSSTSTDVSVLVDMLLAHVSHINKAIGTTRGINVVTGGQVVQDCLELMDLSRDRVTNSIQVLVNSNKLRKTNTNDVNTWLSAVLTNYVTCLDQLQDYSHLLELKSIIEKLISSSRIILAIQANVLGDTSNSYASKEILLGSGTRRMYPSWVRRSDSKLLRVSGSEIKANVVVAKDGSGNFTTVAEVVASAPDKGKKRYVIYVKEGVYEEIVEVGKKKKNVMIVGDGMNLTVISGSLNVVDGNTTFRSATLAAVGDGFILQDICIRNTAGPEKHQAVALRVGADQSVINRCKIEAYQDTLYAHSLRQFYTYSYISGTVDFIFGNAAVVLQNCELVARLPMASQKNMVTAQGRTDPFQNTGTSIQYCDIVASSDLAPVKAKFPTFLGRPWKNFSRTVVMQSNISDHIDPRGWFEWDGDFALDTLYYAEYMNYGLGADTSKRVNWTGYNVITDPKEARNFTVGVFIQGQEWLDEAGVTYVEGL